MEVLHFLGGAMVLDKLPVPGHPTNLGNRRARPTVVAVVAGGVVWTFFSLICHFSSFSHSLGDGPI